MPLLFCYGSNHPAQLAARLGHPTRNRGAYATDVGRVFRGWSERWQGGVASLKAMRGVTTFGYVAQVSAADLRQMDAFEGVASGHYRREAIRVEIGDGSEDAEAICYVSTSRKHARPSRAYLEAICLTIGAFWEGERGPVKPGDIVIR